MQSLGPVTLSGSVVRLEPLRRHHRDALLNAAQDERIWAWLPSDLRDPAGMDAFIEECVLLEERGQKFAFAVILQESGRVVGSTRYNDIAQSARSVEIGWTWYSLDVWGTGVNTEAKYLLMHHAFDNWNAIRVWFKTDELNERSRASLVKLGARFEGVLRNHRIRPDGSYRNSAIFSIIGSEWPMVKANLTDRLSSA
jgi:N-acetyltransferase